MAAAALAAQAAQSERFERLFGVFAEHTHADGKSNAHLATNLVVGTRTGAAWPNVVAIVADGTWLKKLCSDPEKLADMRHLYEAASSQTLFGFTFDANFIQLMRDVLVSSFPIATAQQREAGAIVRRILTETANMSAVAAAATIESLCAAGGGRPGDRHFDQVHDRLLNLYVGAHTYSLATAFCPTDRTAVPEIRWSELYGCVFRIAQSVCNATDMDQLKAAYVSLHTALMAERSLWFALNAAAPVPGARVQHAGPVPPNSASARGRRDGTKHASAQSHVNTPTVVLTATPTVTQTGKQRTPRVPCSKCVAAGQIDSVARSHAPDQCIAVNADNTPRSKAEISAALKIKNAAAAAAAKKTP